MSQQRCRNDEGIFEEEETYDPTGMKFACLLMVQMYTIAVYYFLGAYVELEHGIKGPEQHRRHGSFEEKVGNKVSDHFFRRIYRVKRSSFYRLHKILKPRLKRIFFP